MMIKWSKTMSVGVARLDRDHKVLVALINRLADAGDDRAGGGDRDRGPGAPARVDPGAEEAGRNKVMADVLETLVAYTVFHFCREEAVMEACGYPQAAAHHEEHVALTEEVRDWERRFRENPRLVEQGDMLLFLKGWLNHHILLQDKAYRPWTEGNPAGEAAAEAHGLFNFAAAAFAASEEELEKAC